jgi:cobalt-zinc-cadmium efflux system protein
MHRHDHHHGFAATREEGLSALRLAIGTSVALLLVQIVGGLVSHSLALLADAAHVLSDVVALVLSYAAARLASRPATLSKSYGFYRLEILAAVVNGTVLLLLSAVILWEAWQRFRHPVALHPGVMAGTAGLALAGNLVALLALRRTRAGGLNLRAAYLEVFSDTLGSAGVLLAAVVVMATGWVRADPLLSALLALFIVPRTIHLVNEALHILLEGTPRELDHGTIEAEIRGTAGVVAVHDLHVWSLTSGLPLLTAHVVVDETACDDVLARVSARLTERFGITHSTIQIEHEDRAASEHVHA